MLVEFLLAALLVAWACGWLQLEVAVAGVLSVLVCAGAVGMLTNVGGRRLHDE